MALITVTPEEVLRRKLLNGWFHFKAERYSYDKSSDGESMNHVIHLKGVEGEATNVPVMLFIPEKYPGLGIGYIEATVGHKIDETAGINFDPTAIGHIVKAHVEPRKNKSGVQMNSLTEFAPADASFVQGPATKF